MKFYIDFKDLPFESSFNQVIYAENGYDAETNDYIRKNYKALCRAFKSCGYEFCYLPLMAQQLASKPIADYYAPYNDGFTEVTVGSELLLNYMIRPKIGLVLNPRYCTGILIAGKQTEKIRLCSIEVIRLRS